MEMLGDSSGVNPLHESFRKESEIERFDSVLTHLDLVDECWTNVGIIF